MPITCCGDSTHTASVNACEAPEIFHPREWHDRVWSEITLMWSQDENESTWYCDLSPLHTAMAREWVEKFWAQIFPACYFPRENKVKGQVKHSTGDRMVLLSPARSCHISTDTKITGLQRDELMTSLPWNCSSPSHTHRSPHTPIWASASLFHTLRTSAGCACRQAAERGRFGRIEMFFQMSPSTLTISQVRGWLSL